LYLELLPMLMSGWVRLLDNPRLISQIVNLERKTARGGRDSIDHPPRLHDDVANAASGSLVGCNFKPKEPPIVAPIIVANPDPLPAFLRAGRNPFAVHAGDLASHYWDKRNEGFSIRQ
jgi:hypothetical protein